MKRLVFVFLSAILALNLFSCTQKYNKKLLCDTLFSDYMFEADFTVSSSGESLSGTARVTKQGTAKVEILSPEPYVGLCAENDYSGNAQYISFSYSGIDVDMPKEAFSKINTVLALFSPGLPETIDKLDTDLFEYSNETFEIYNDVLPVAVSFNMAQAKIRLFYDEHTGAPLCFTAQTEDALITIVITKFQTIN